MMETCNGWFRVTCTAGVLVLLAGAETMLHPTPAPGQSTEKTEPSGKKVPFGGDEDVRFAQETWKAIQGYRGWMLRSEVHPGRSPHGSLLRIYSNVVSIQGELHQVLVKDNFAGDGATVESVSASPGKYLVAVTAMVWRKPGYDPEDHDWFWVKYAPDGTIDRNPEGVLLAGKVAKGSDSGCISCHKKAAGGDFIYSNDD